MSSTSVLKLSRDCARLEGTDDLKIVEASGAELGKGSIGVSAIIENNFSRRDETWLKRIYLFIETTPFDLIIMKPIQTQCQVFYNQNVKTLPP